MEVEWQEQLRPANQVCAHLPRSIDTLTEKGPPNCKKQQDELNKLRQQISALEHQLADETALNASYVAKIDALQHHIQMSEGDINQQGSGLYRRRRSSQQQEKAAMELGWKAGQGGAQTHVVSHFEEHGLEMGRNLEFDMVRRDARRANIQSGVLIVLFSGFLAFVLLREFN